MELTDLLIAAINQNASDLHLVTGSVPVLRVGRELVQINTSVLTSDAIVDMLRPYLSADQQAQLVSYSGDCELILRHCDRRFRGHSFRDIAGIGIAFRQVPNHIPTLDALYASPHEVPVLTTLQQLVKLEQGLVVVAGPSGSGKCTTAAAMVDAINCDSARRIMVIDSVMDYEFCSKRSLVTQHIIGRDFDTFSQAVHTIMHTNVDVVYIGELLSMDMIRLALGLAETGHLVFAVLNATSAAEAITRRTEVFPEPRDTIKRMLARSLAAVLSQQLLPRCDRKGRVAAMEILLSNPQVRKIIAAGDADINSAIQASGAEGMQTMRQALEQLANGGVITQDQAAMAG